MPDSHSFAPTFDAPGPRGGNRARASAPDDVGEPAPEPDEDFDPAAHTVDEVKAYVEAYPDYAPDILEAEQDGKNRVTLVEWLDNFGES